MAPVHKGYAMPNATTSNAPAPTAQVAPTGPAAQLASALGLPHLLAQAPTVAAHLAAWAASTSAGRRGITVQGTYLAAAAVATVLNGGQPVTPGHVAATYLALGAVAPGRGNLDGFGASNGYTLGHSAYYGANKHLKALGGVQHGKGTAQGAPTWLVPAAVLAGVQLTPQQQATMRNAAQQQLAAYQAQPCGCNAKGRAARTAIAAGTKVAPGTGTCASGRKVGNGQFAAPAPATVQQPAKPATPTKQPTTK